MWTSGRATAVSRHCSLYQWSEQAYQVGCIFAMATPNGNMDYLCTPHQRISDKQLVATHHFGSRSCQHFLPDNNYLELQSMLLAAVVLNAWIAFRHQCVTFHCGVWMLGGGLKVFGNGYIIQIANALENGAAGSSSTRTRERRAGENAHNFRTDRRQRL